MKHLLIIVFAILPILSGCTKRNSSKETTTYYLIRHAEKDRSDSNNKNPHLTEIGKSRALNWSKILQHIPFDAVYSTDYYRTRETAQPTATKNGLDVNIYDENKLNITSFLNENKGKTVLIVGHSNTIPQLVNSVLDSEKYTDIEDNNNGNLYMITIIGDEKLDQVLTIN